MDEEPTVDSPRTRRRNARYDELISAAAVMFAKKGYRDTTIQEIAQELDMTSAAIYYYADSKEKLLYEIWQRAGAKLQNGIDDEIRQGGTAVEQLRRVFRRHVQVILADKPIFEVIDVNLACPVKKIRARARGGHWLAEPDGAIEILRAVREAVPASVPCTVKLRRSFDDTPEMAANFDRILDAAFALGYAWATVHGRTVAQKYIGPSRWDILRDIVRRHPDHLIFGSGDVWDVHEIFRMIGYTGVAAAAVARGCIRNPWKFRQARQMMAGEPPAAPSTPAQRTVLEEHFRIAARLSGEHHASKQMRKFGIRFAAHHPQGEQVRLRFIAVSSLDQWRAVLDEHYA
mgnify:CR=1 FL=1